MDELREPAFDPRDRERYKELLREYQRLKPDYDELARYLEGRTHEIAKRVGIFPIIMARAKSVESLAEKVQRPGKKYGLNPLDELTDLCGVRVITHFLGEIPIFAHQLHEEFIIDEKNSGDKKDTLALDQFGYLSLHLIVRLRNRPNLPGKTDEELDRFTTMRTEIQLRTIGQHMWADVYHEMGYKNEFQLPARWQREFARAAALLESVDLGFQETRAAMATYESSYSAYMTDEQLKCLANRLEDLLEVDEKNERALHRLIRVYLALEGSDKKLTDMLNDYSSLLKEYPPAFRDVGFAYTKVNKPDENMAGFEQGQDLLRKAIAHDPDDVDAHCTLGGTYRKLKEYDKALQCYREGYHRDPTNPYALGNYIVEQLIQSKDPELINVFYGVIQGALERCRKLLEVQVNFPWALYDLAMFLLYRGELNASYRFFAKGVDASSRSWMVDTAASTIGRLVDHGIPLKGLDLAHRMLALGGRVKKERPPESTPESQGPVFRMPLVILAGGCAGLTLNDREMMQILPRVLAGFRGTLVSGGTNSGIAAIPGNLQTKTPAGELVTIGYVPVNVEALGEQPHSGYSKIVRTSGMDFSISEALTFWEHYWNAGYDPAKVKLIGFNGGDIAAVEYRLALALGAKVGIVQGSGREADRLLEDPLWKDHPRLESLNPSEEDFRRFLIST